MFNLTYSIYISFRWVGSTTNQFHGNHVSLLRFRCSRQSCKMPKAGLNSVDGLPVPMIFQFRHVAFPSLYPWRYSCKKSPMFLNRRYIFKWSCLVFGGEATPARKLKQKNAGRSRLFLLWGSIEEVTQTAGLHFLQQAGCFCVCFFCSPPTFSSHCKKPTSVRVWEWWLRWVVVWKLVHDVSRVMDKRSE